MGLNLGSLASGIGGAIPGVGPTISSGIGLVTGLFGGAQPKDGRLISNDFAYKAALAGNPNGLIALKGHGGLGDGVLTGPIAGIPSYRAGSRMVAWDRADIRADAAQKYGSVVGAAAQGSGGAANALGPATDETPAGQAREALTSTVAGVPMWALVLGAGALGFVLLRRR